MPLKSATPSKSDRQLKLWYGKFNRLYFEGKLPDASVWWEPTHSAYADCNFIDGKFVIRMNPAICAWTSMAKWTLLHEMVHVKLHPYDKHGKKFHNEMMRLAERGAFTGIW
jgi:hypothetical protein